LLQRGWTRTRGNAPASAGRLEEQTATVAPPIWPQRVRSGARSIFSGVRGRPLILSAAAGIALLFVAIPAVFASPASAPQNVSATAGQNQATVSWQAPASNGGSAITAYKVVAFQGTAARNATTTSASATTTTITGLPGGATYTFQITAINADGLSPAASTGSVTPTGAATTYPSTVLGDSPSVYYRLDDSSSIAADSSGNARDATYSGGSQGSGGALVGDSDTAVTNSVVTENVAAGLPLGASARSLEIWMKQGGDGALMGYGASGTTSQIYFYVINGNQITFDPGSNAQSFTAPYPIENNTWHHVVASYDGTSVTMYLDGQSLGTKAVTVNTTSGSALLLGRNPWCACFYNGGTLDEAAVYGSALSASQVMNHFNASGNGRPSASGNVVAVPGTNSATVSWMAPASSPGSAITQYLVRSGSNSKTVSGTTTSTTLTGLAGGAAYTFQVTAVNGFGNGPSAAANSVTPTGAASTYASTVLGDSPSVYYRLDDSSSIAADSSGNARDATYSGGSQGSGGALVGDSDTAVTNSVVTENVAAGLPLGASARSLEIWMKQGGDGALMGYGTSGGGSQIYMYVNNGNQLTFDPGANGQSFTAPYPIENNTWHHIVASYDGTSVTMYLDGQSLGTKAVTVNTTAGSALLLGRNPWCGCFYNNGTLDEAVVYPSALNATQVMNHFNASGNGRPSAPGNVVAVPGTNSATISWTTPPSNAGSPIFRYLIRSSSGGKDQNSVAVSGSSTSYTMTGLQGGASYTFAVSARNQSGDGTVAVSSSITPKGAVATYASTVIGDSPTIYYRLDDTSKATESVPTAADSSGNGRDATYNAGSQGSSGALLNDNDGAETNSVVIQNGAAGLPLGASVRSFETWMKQGGDGALMGYGASGTASQIYLYVINGNQLTFDQGGNAQSFTAPYAIENNTWHHVVATYDGANATMYLDGQSLGSKAVAVNTTSGSALVVGRNPWCGCFYNSGTLDEVAVYGAALSASQVQAHFNASGYMRPTTPTGLRVWAGPGSARVSWSQSMREVGGQYTVTPIVSGTAQPAITVDQSVSSALVPNLPAGSSVTFQIQPQSSMGSVPAATSPPVTPAPALASPGDTSGIGVFVGYADGLRSGTYFPPLWPTGSANDNGGVLVTNSSSSTVTVGVSVTMVGSNGSWGSKTLPPGDAEVIVGPDSSDANGANCTPSGSIPVIHVSVGSSTMDYRDDNQVLNTKGIDAGNCNGGQNEASKWQQVGGPPSALEVLNRNESEKPCFVCTGLPINTATGNFSHDFSDFSIPGRGMPIGLKRSYNSLASGYDSIFGFGWSSSYDMYLTQDSTQTITVHQEGGSTVTFTATSTGYQAPSRVLAQLVQNADGNFTFSRNDQSHYQFDSRGELTAETDRNGYTTAFGYANSLLTQVTDPASRTLTLGYTGNHVTQVSDSSGRQATYQYDANGNLLRVTDVDAGVTQFTYSGHLLVTMQNPNCSARQSECTYTNPDGTFTGVANIYDASGRVIRQYDDLGRKTAFSFVPGQTTITDPRGNVTVDAYQGTQLMTETKGYGTPQAATWQYTYDATTLGMTSMTDPNGHQVHNTWDARGNMLTHRDGLDRQTTYTYDSLNDVLTVRDPLQVTTTNAYDTAGNLQRSSTPLTGSGQTKTVTYQYTDANHAGDVTRLVDPDGKVWQYAYDQFGNRTTSIDPLGDKTTVTFDLLGRPQTKVSPNGYAIGPLAQYTTTYNTYTAFGDLTQMTDPLGRQTNNTYDGNRHLIQVKDPNQHTTVYKYDLADQLVEVDRPDGSKLGTTYDGDGNIATQVDGLTNATTYTYDPLNHKSSLEDPLHRKTNYSIDAVGNLTSVTDPQQQATTYAYDAADELTSVAYSDGTTPTVGPIHYDADGQRLDSADGTGTSHYVYDSLHRLTQQTTGAGAQVGYGYDLRGHGTSITYPANAGQVTRGYDDAGRMHTVSDWLGNTTTFNYDANSNMVGQVYPANNGTTATFSPDAANQINTISDSKSGTPFLSLNYLRDGNGNLKSDSGTTYGYDPNDRLTTSGPGTYNYDAADNLTKLTNNYVQNYDPANEVLASQSPITSVGTPTSNGDPGPSGSVTVTLPSGIQQGDQILFAVTYQSTGTITAPPEYRVAATKTSAGTTPAQTTVFQKTASGGESTVPITLGGVPAGSRSWVAAAYRGADPVNPIDASSTAASGSGATSLTVPSVSASLGGERLLMFEGAGGNTPTGTFAPSGMTDVTQKTQTLSAAGLAEKPLTAAGSTGTQAFGFSGPGGANLTGVLVALKPSLTSFAYDLRGSRKSVTIPNGSTTNLAYDQANRLSAFGTGSSYGYAGDGLRMSKTVSGQTQQFTWDQAEGLPSMLTDGTGANYIYGPGGVPVEQAYNRPAVQLVDKQTGGDATTSSVKITFGQPIQAGDLILLASTQNNGNAVNTPPQYQWVQQASSSGTLNPASILVFAHTAAAGETSVTLTYGGTFAKSVVAAVYRGADPTHNYDAQATGSVNGGPTVPLAGGSMPLPGETLAMFSGATGHVLPTTWTSGSLNEQAQKSDLPLTSIDFQDKPVPGAGVYSGPSDTFGTSAQLAAVAVAVRPPSKAYFYHQDQLGSTRAVTDAGGTVVATYSYDAYGNTVQSSGPISVPLRYAGQYQDSESGLYYLRARYYDPATGQFISRDPIVTTTRQPYAYVDDTPLNRTDPTGLYDCGWEVWNCIQLDNLWQPDRWGSQISDNWNDPAARTIALGGGMVAGLACVLGGCEAAAAGGAATAGWVAARKVGCGLVVSGIGIGAVLVHDFFGNPSDKNAQPDQPHGPEGPPDRQDPDPRPGPPAGAP
jgi:RHS repeat-associated protein